MLAAIAEAYARPVLSPRAPALSAAVSSARILLNFFCGRGAVEAIHVVVAKGGVPDESSDVDGRSRPIECRDVIGESGITEVLSRCRAEFIGSGGSPLSRTGEALMPQLPTITVVTPCEILGSISGRFDHAGVVVRVHVDESRARGRVPRLR